MDRLCLNEETTVDDQIELHGLLEQGAFVIDDGLPQPVSVTASARAGARRSWLVHPPNSAGSSPSLNSFKIPVPIYNMQRFYDLGSKSAADEMHKA